MKDLKSFLQESILDTIKKELDPTIWYNNKLKPSVKAHIVSKLEAWQKTTTAKPIEKIYFVGSAAGFQYTETSDIDINFLIKMPKEEYVKTWNSLPNGHNLPGTKHPINYYLITEPENMNKKSGAIYDVLKNRWIREPSIDKKKDVFSNFKAVTEIARFFVLGVNAAIAEYEMDKQSLKMYENYDNEDDEIKAAKEHKEFELKADLDCLYIAKHVLKSLRKEAYTSDKLLEIKTDIKVKDSDTSINNLIYKYIEKLGYFEKLDKILKEREE